jgi:uncharacterized protein YqiB (DUF1249 family)
MKRNERIFKNLNVMGVVSCVANKVDHAKSKVDCDEFMDLSLDVLNVAGEKARISLAHYYTQNGDLMADPDMEIELDMQAKTAEPLTFRMDAPPLYQDVNESEETNIPLQHQLSDFLDQWISNCINQGHSFNAK